MTHPLHDLAMQIRYDLTAAQGKLTELLRQIHELEPSATGPACPHCGYRPSINMPSIAEHIERHHPDGHILDVRDNRLIEPLDVRAHDGTARQIAGRAVAPVESESGENARAGLPPSSDGATLAGR